MEIIEVVWNVLKGLVLSLHEDTFSTMLNNKTSTNFTHDEVQEEIVHQLNDPMDIKKHYSTPLWSQSEWQPTTIIS